MLGHAEHQTIGQVGIPTGQWNAGQVTRIQGGQEQFVDAAGRVADDEFFKRGGVEGPFEQMKPIYDLLGVGLGPLGLKLDYERIKETRPRIAELLR